MSPARIIDSRDVTNIKYHNINLIAMCLTNNHYPIIPVDKESGSNLAQLTVNKGQPALAQAAPHHMNNGSRPAPAAAPAAPAAAPAAAATAPAAAPAAPADVQKLQQQLHDIKEQVSELIIRIRLQSV